MKEVLARELGGKRKERVHKDSNCASSVWGQEGGRGAWLGANLARMIMTIIRANTNPVPTMPGTILGALHINLFDSNNDLMW